MHALMTAQSKTKKATVSQWFRVLGVSRLRWYAARQQQRGTRQSSMLSIQAKAAFNSPPEDVGGLPGYMDCLEAMHNPTHEQHADYWRWWAGHFDAKAFSINVTNFAIR